MLIRNLVIVWLAFSAAASAQTVRGAGSALPQTLYQEWFHAYKKRNPTEKLQYKVTPSESGIRDLIDGKVDFAATETPLNPDQLRVAREKLGSELLLFPTALGAVVPICSLAEARVMLRFTRAALAGIYLGSIAQWSNPEIADANPTVLFPDDRIAVLHRSEASDTTYLFTEFLSAVSPVWRSGPGIGASVKWPNGIGVSTDAALQQMVLGKSTNDFHVDDVIRGIPNSIGYVQLRFAIENELPYGDVQNASGAFVRATKSSITAAATSVMASVPDGYRRSLVNSSDPAAYPISTFTWIVVPANMNHNPAKAKAMAAFLRWALTDGQSLAQRLRYVPLPDEVSKAALQEVAKLQ